MTADSQEAWWFLWGISQTEMSSWWTTAEIQGHSQKTPEGYMHRLGHPSTTPTTPEKEPY